MWAFTHTYGWGWLSLYRFQTNKFALRIMFLPNSYFVFKFQMTLEYGLLNIFNTHPLNKGFIQGVRGLIWLKLPDFSFYGSMKFRDSVCPEMESNHTIFPSLLHTFLSSTLHWIWKMVVIYWVLWEKLCFYLFYFDTSEVYFLGLVQTDFYKPPVTTVYYTYSQYNMQNLSL